MENSSENTIKRLETTNRILIAAIIVLVVFIVIILFG